MERTRTVAVRLAGEGDLDIMQRGQVIPKPFAFKGPIRLRLPLTTSEKKAEVPAKKEEA
jgi:hypothetical protein